MTPTILGVDPGARETGLVVIRGGDLLAHAIVIAGEKLDPRNPVDLGYLRKVLAGIEELLGSSGVGHALDAVAIEAVGAPNPHLGMTNVAGIVALAAVIGAISAWAGDLGDPVPVLLIEPDGHGKDPLRAYPPTLVGPREARGGGILRHCRSAYSIALAARWYLKTGAARS